MELEQRWSTDELWARNNIEELLENHRLAEEADTEAKAAREATEAVWEAVKEARAVEVAKEKEIAKEVQIRLHQTHTALALAFSNMAADTAVHTCESLVTREELVEKIRQAINTKLAVDTSNSWNKSLEEQTVWMLEILQTGDSRGLERSDLENIAGGYVTSQGKPICKSLTSGQLHRVWNVLCDYCPTRVDTGKLATPYRMKCVDGFIMPE